MSLLLPHRRFMLTSGTRYAPETVAYLAALSVQPNALRALVIDTYIRGLIAAGIWPLLDLLYLLAAHDEQAARVNAKSPGNFTASKSNSPTFVTDRGYTGDGATSRLQTGYTPSTNGVQFLRDSASVWVWCLTSVLENVGRAGNTSVTPRTRLITRSSSGHLQVLINDNTTDDPGTNNSVGFNGASRVGASLKRAWKNGIQFGGDFTTASTGVAAGEQWILGASTIQFSTEQMALAAWGASLTGLELAFYNLTLAYMQGVGAA